jgi:hypothetical protein
MSYRRCVIEGSQVDQCSMGPLPTLSTSLPGRGGRFAPEHETRGDFYYTTAFLLIS